METEKFELMLDEAQANAALEKGMLYADTFVNKNYLINLDRYPLVELDPAEKSDEYIRLYQIERIVYDVDENANDKLISVYSAFFNIQAAGLLVIKSTRNALGFYIGVRSVDNTSTAEAILEKSFKGNFAGSQIQAIPQEEVQKVLGSINKSGRFGTRQNVSSVSIVPSTRDELVFVGAYKILVNLIPHKTNGVPNDGYIVKMLDAHIAMRKDYALYLRIYADTFLNKAISPSDYQYERNESLSDDELLYYNEIQEILKSINAQMSKHEIDHCKGIVI